MFSNLKGLDLTLIHKPTKQNFEVKTKFGTTSLKPGETGNKFILDIDCYTTEQVNVKTEKLLSLATQAHDILEEVFENLITEKTRNYMEVEK